MNGNNLKMSEKAGQKDVIHGAVWFGAPAMLIYDIVCLITAWLEGSSKGFAGMVFILSSFSLFFCIGCFFKNFNKSVKDRRTAGWMYATAMGINYLLSLITLIVSIVNLSAGYSALNVILIVVSAVFFFVFNVNDIINTVITVKKLSAIRKNVSD